MMTDTEKQRIEECVVQIECVNKLNKEEIELGTGFFCRKKRYYYCKSCY